MAFNWKHSGSVEFVLICNAVTLNNNAAVTISTYQTDGVSCLYEKSVVVLVLEDSGSQTLVDPRQRW